MDTPKLSAGSVVLKVTLETLIAKADEVLKDVTAIKQYLDTIGERIEGTSAYWIGEAGDLHRKLWNDQKEEIDSMMRRLNEHPKDLKAIAANYTSAEKEVTSVASALTDNVII